MNDEFASFEAALGRWRARVGIRAIAAGDERAFEAPADEPLALRRASGAARIVARELLGEFGADRQARLARTFGRFPLWPAAFVGSLAHDDVFAAAVVAPVCDVAAIGIDVEPAEPLPEEVIGIALSPSERREVGRDARRARLIFCAKEAVYKAVNPYDGTSLEYEDIAVNLREGSARLADGRKLELATHVGTRLLVAAISRENATAP